MDWQILEDIKDGYLMLIFKIVGETRSRFPTGINFEQKF